MLHWELATHGHYNRGGGKTAIASAYGTCVFGKGFRDPGEAKLSVRAGLAAALCWGGLGALAAAVAVALWGWGDRWDSLSDLGDYDAWAGSFARTALWPVLGCAWVFGCTGWAARAPRPPRRIASTALIIAGASLVMWTLIAAVELTPRRTKSVEHPEIYWSELVALLSPPLATAIALTFARRPRAEPIVGSE